ncbi:DUF4132 domain-containing protein [Burkholderia sp. Ac-20353]|uniref:DUF4132 domain-containing protein n=1 Tax=Burkholderia sp. Ac-20353 TaxID=2703894 RepID=UPI00197C1020|nr:DUF4132 domain-containing protein [Burkholderia sp. Ac-20353]MBN3788610.1 DUF4132 domain-containing protein [Burkholderia sp. Ac-20353]
MNESTRTALADRLIAMLDGTRGHPRFDDAPPDLSGLDAHLLGKVWPALRRADHLPDYADPRRECARWLHEQIDTLDLVPLLDEPASIELCRDIAAGDWKRALRELPYLSLQPSRAVQDQLDRILRDTPEGGWRSSMSYGVFALEYFAGRRGRTALRDQVAESHEDSPFRARECDALEELGPAALLALAATNDGYFAPKRLWFDLDDPAVTLADEIAYVEFARETLTGAARIVADLHGGRMPYAADRAFTTDDAQVVARAARVAAYRDEPWFRPLIGPLLTGVCVAPTAAKTAPSQSLAIAVGHAIETIPTPESVRALRDALAVVRHAGVQKKLARNLKPAERALGERPRTALRMTLDAKPDKKQLAMLATCMEAGFWQTMTLDVAEWRQRLVDAPAGAAFSTRMIWNAHARDGAIVSFMPDATKDGIVLHDAAGAPCEIDAHGTVRLWHPLLADAAERLAWQRAVVERRIRQHVRQAFREFYVPAPADQPASDTAMFDGHVLAVRPLLGLARREGWAIRSYDDGLVREFGDVRATFGIAARLYPGADGYGTSGAIGFERRDERRWIPVPITQLDPVVFSEIARAADLLVSVAGFALGDDASDAPLAAAERDRWYAERQARDDRLYRLSALPLGVMAQHRRHTLSLVLADRIAQGAVAIDERHVRVGEFSVHCATGRVTRGGEPVDMALEPAASLPRSGLWVPYDEALLQRIVDVVASLLK